MFKQKTTNKEAPTAAYSYMDLLTITGLGTGLGIYTSLGTFTLTSTVTGTATMTGFFTRRVTLTGMGFSTGTRLATF